VSENTEQAAGQGQSQPGSPPAAPGSNASGPIPSGEVSNEPGLLSLVHSDSQVLVGFNYKDMPDETRVARYRAQLLEFLQRTNCKSLKFDMRGVKIIPSRMLGFFVSLKNEGHEIELIDLEQGVQDVIRLTRLSSMFTIRPIAKS